jgi:drug/metabolite transporter (DMT)-like permease
MATLAARTSSLINPHSMSAAFIVLWSTAWIAGKFGLQFTGPLTLLEIRLTAAALFMLLIAFVTRAPWPQTRSEYVHLGVAGLLINGLTLAAMYIGMKAGVSTGVSALIAALTPLFTAVAAGTLFGERIGARRWAGLAVGLFGVALVVMHRMSFTGAGWEGYAITFLAVVLFVAGTLYQKRYCGEIDLRTGNAIQFAVASVALLIPALGFEGFRVEWTETVALSVAWMALVNSGVAVSLFYLLLRQGQASRVTTLFYLVPPITAAMGFFAFGETLGTTALVGFVLAVVGVYFGSGSASTDATGSSIRTGAPAVCTVVHR